MCVLACSKGGKKRADFAVQDGAKLFSYTVLLWASIQPVDCLFGFADSKQTPNHCGNPEHEKLFLLLLYFDASRISCFLSCRPSEFSLWVYFPGKCVPYVACCRGIQQPSRALFAVVTWICQTFYKLKPLSGKWQQLGGICFKSVLFLQARLLTQILPEQHKLSSRARNQRCRLEWTGGFPDSLVSAFSFPDW